MYKFIVEILCTHTKYMKYRIQNNNKRPPGLIAPLLRIWHLLGNPPKNTTKGRDLLFNEGIRLLNMAVKISLI